MSLPSNIIGALLLLLVLFSSASTTHSFTTKQIIPTSERKTIRRPSSTITKMNNISDDCDRSQLPGDPSLVLQTNVNLGSEKMNVMKACSKAVASSLGKPESYVAISVTDNASLLFGGLDDPCALGVVYSLGSINKENNGALTAAVSEILEPFGVVDSRIYVNFFDVPRANVGWKKATFAG